MTTHTAGVLADTGSLNNKLLISELHTIQSCTRLHNTPQLNTITFKSFTKSFITPDLTKMLFFF